MEGILGTKIGMTHVFVGLRQVPVTVVKAGPTYVVQKKTKCRDGYEAVQIGFSDKKPSRVNRPISGHLKKHGAPAVYHLREFACAEMDSLQQGGTINCADVFEAGQYVDVSATSKGKGFAGVMKRHHFQGGPESHGSMHNRAPGSLGQSSWPSRVFKNMRMGGHMGDRRVTVQNLEIVEVKGAENVLLIKGAVPGSVGAIVEIRRARKKS